MPYKVKGSDVYHFKNGVWSIKQHCSSPAAAHSAMNLLEGVEHGWHPTGNPKRKTWLTRGR
jgi:hypothetical protein